MSLIIITLYNERSNVFDYNYSLSLITITVYNERSNVFESAAEDIVSLIANSAVIRGRS